MKRHWQFDGHPDGVFMIAKLSVAAVALLHIAFMYMECVLWNKPAGRRIFAMSETQARLTTALAANQGLYNGFLAAGLGWGLLHDTCGRGIIIFFLVCIVVAGIFGAITASRSILWLQGLPGAIALSLVLLDPDYL
jgi:putative membrane protein